MHSPRRTCLSQSHVFLLALCFYGLERLVCESCILQIWAAIQNWRVTATWLVAYHLKCIFCGVWVNNFVWNFKGRPFEIGQWSLSHYCGQYWDYILSIISPSLSEVTVTHFKMGHPKNRCPGDLQMSSRDLTTKVDDQDTKILIAPEIGAWWHAPCVSSPGKTFPISINAFYCIFFFFFLNSSVGGLCHIACCSSAAEYYCIVFYWRRVQLNGVFPGPHWPHRTCVESR